MGMRETNGDGGMSCGSSREGGHRGRDPPPFSLRIDASVSVSIKGKSWRLGQLGGRDGGQSWDPPPHYPHPPSHLHPPITPS